MAWGFRRSVSFGGVRFTFSKSGVSTSVGRKGLRLTSGPRGVYITTGAGGFYYRQRLDVPPRSERGNQSQVAPDGPVTNFGSAQVDRLTSVTQQEFVDSLNEWTTRGHLQIAVGVVGALSVAAGAMLDAAGPVVAEVLLYALLAFAAAYRIEHHRRRFLMLYDLSDEARQRYDELSKAVETLSGPGALRGIKLHVHHGDWKRNAGATKSVEFQRARIRRATPPYIVTNVPVLALGTQGKELFFMPDRLLVREGRRYAALAYSELDVDVSTGRFVWDEHVPPGAEVIGYSWLYVRRDGGPDRRFNNNREIPNLRVAYLMLRSSSGLQVLLLATRVEQSLWLEHTLQHYSRRRSSAMSGPTATWPPEVRAALATLGLIDMPDAPGLHACYLDLIKRNHPDRFATASLDIRAFAETRTKEINSAYEQLRPMAPWTQVASDPAGPPEVAPNDATIATPHVENLERNTVLMLVAATLLVCVGARLSEHTQILSASVRNTSVRSAAYDEPVGSARLPVETSTIPADATRTRIPRACTVRAEPSASSAAIGAINAGAFVDTTAHRGDWVRIIANGRLAGWTGPACWRP